MVFVIHWHELAMDLHVFPIPIPAPTSLSAWSLWVFPVHQARALVSCIQPGLVICFTLDNIHVSVLFSWNIPPSGRQILNHWTARKVPTLMWFNFCFPNGELCSASSLVLIGLFISSFVKFLFNFLARYLNWVLHLTIELWGFFFFNFQ